MRWSTKKQRLLPIGCWTNSNHKTEHASLAPSRSRWIPLPDRLQKIWQEERAERTWWKLAERSYGKTVSATSAMFTCERDNSENDDIKLQIQVYTMVNINPVLLRLIRTRRYKPPSSPSVSAIFAWSDKMFNTPFLSDVLTTAIYFAIKIQLAPSLHRTSRRPAFS